MVFSCRPKVVVSMIVDGTATSITKHISKYESPVLIFQKMIFSGTVIGLLRLFKQQNL